MTDIFVKPYSNNWVYDTKVKAVYRQKALPFWLILFTHLLIIFLKYINNSSSISFQTHLLSFFLLSTINFPFKLLHHLTIHACLTQTSNASSIHSSNFSLNLLSPHYCFLCFIPHWNSIKVHLFLYVKSSTFDQSTRTLLSCLGDLLTNEIYHKVHYDNILINY